MKELIAIGVALIIGQVLAADPLPIRRTVVTAEQLAAELGRADRATWVRLTRAEFEAQVARASEGQEQRSRPPLLLQTHYAAQCAGEQMTGTGEWVIRPQGPAPGCLSIEPLSLALRSAQWSNELDALIGPLHEPASGWEVMVPGGDEKTLKLTWSSRGRRRPDGLYFSLSIPEAGITTLDLRLPVDQALVTKSDQCQIVEVQADGSDHRRWTMAASGTRQLDLVVVPRSAGQPLWLVGQRQRCHLNNAMIECEWQLQVSAAPLWANQLEFEVDPTVVVSEVTVPGLKAWENVRSNLYRVQFAEPTMSSTITVRGVMAVKDAAPWMSPALNVVNSISLGETIVLSVPSEVALEDFRIGGFRMIQSQFRASGQQVMTLQSSWARRADGSRPNARLRRAAGTVDVSENNLWSIATDRQSITGRWTVRPRHEPLSSWAIVLPPFWDVDNVECPTNDRLRWSVRRDAQQRATLLLEVDQPIAPGQEWSLLLEFRGRPLGSAEAALAFPVFEPQRIRQRDVRWQVQGSSSLDIKAELGPFSLAYADESGPLPQGATNVSWVFPMGRVEGVVVVQPKTARFSAAGAGRLRVDHDELISEYRLALRPEFGSLTGVRLIAPASSNGNGHWQAGSGFHIRSCKRVDPWGHAIAAIAASESSLGAIAVTALADQAGKTWQVTFDRPISQPVTLDYTERLRAEPDSRTVLVQQLAGLASFPLTAVGLAINVPPPQHLNVCPALWSVAGAAAQEHTWRYYDFSNRTQPPIEWRKTDGVPSLRYRDLGPNVPIDLSTRDSLRLLIAKARITASVTGDSRVLVRYQASLRGASGTSVAVDLPPDAELLEVQLAGHVLSGMRQRGQRIEIVIPDKSGTVPIELTYTLPGLGFWPVGQLHAAAPRWPGDVDATLWSWQLPPGWNALFVSRAESVAKQSTGENHDENLEWQVFPGDGSTIWVTQPNSFQRTCWMTTALALIFALLWQPMRAGTTIALAVSIMAWFITPGPARALLLGPMVIFAVMFAWNLWPNWRWRWQAASTMVTVLVLGVVLATDEPAPRTVWLTLPRDNEPALAYAPADLLDKLKQMATGSQPTTGWIVHSARYRTQLNQERVDTRLNWIVEAFRPDQEFAIPITGHDLVELTVDGEPGSPKLQDGQLRIAIKERRQVEIQARLSTQPKAQGNVFTFQCTIPPTLQARWEVDSAAGLQLNPVGAGFGAVIQEPRRCTVDLGRATKLECTWQVDQAETPKWLVHETYLWDLSSPAARLYGIFKRQQLTNGENVWAIDVPAELMPMTVRALQRHQPLTWQLSPNDGGQRLDVRTFGPVDNDLFIVEFVPRQSLNPSLPLPVPACQHAAVTIIAWRGGNDVRPGPARGFLTINEDVFRRDWLEPAQINDFSGPIRAWRKSATANEPFVRVNVAPTPLWKGEPLLRWQLGPGRAELSVQASLQTDGDTLSLIEWEVPLPVTIAEVTGPAVAQWNRYGTRLQVWLTHPHSQTTFEIVGFVNRTDEGGRFDVPVVRLLNGSPTQRLAIASRPGWELTATIAQQLTAMPQPTIDELWYRNDRPTYRLSVQPRPAQRTADYRLTTSAQVSEGRPTAQVTIEARSSTNRLAGATISMSVNPGDEVLVQASDLKLIEVPALPGQRRWTVHPTGATSKKWFVHFQFVGHGAVRSWSIPVTRLHFADQQPLIYQHELTLGTGLRAADFRGLEPITTNRWRTRNDHWRLDVDMISPMVPQRSR